MSLLSDHLPPQSLDAEQATLGAALISRNAVERALEMLEREDFYLEAHRKIFDVIAYLSERDDPVDEVTVTEELRRRDQLEQIGGIAYINRLQESVPTAAHVEYYARTVGQKSTLRKLIDASNEIIGKAHDQEEEVDHIVDHAERLIFAVAQRRVNQGFTHIRPVVFETLEHLETVRANDSRITGIPTGFTPLDQMTSGLQRGDLVIVAGRPSMGKTSLALAFGLNAASLADTPVAVFSLEMSKEQLAHRLICSEGKVDGMRLKTGFLRTSVDDDESDYIRLGRACGRLGDLPIYIDDASDISVLDMRAKCRRLKSEHGLGMVLVDYLQLIRGHGKPENRNQEISVIARSLKSMARELDVPVVALSQLSRGVERREDKRPMLSDLRESGSIEAEADIVMMLYRSRYYNRGEDGDGMAEPPPGQEWLEETELIVAKHRNGPVGTVRLGFLRRYARFEDLAMEGYEPLDN
ncbi:MAG: replicative DNA helicase [Armatimonadota bacterium]